MLNMKRMGAYAIDRASLLRHIDGRTRSARVAPSLGVFEARIEL